MRIKVLYAMGWKMNSEGALELTSNDKVNILNNVYILYRQKPQQMGACPV